MVLSFFVYSIFICFYYWYNAIFFFHYLINFFTHWLAIIFRLFIIFMLLSIVMFVPTRFTMPKIVSTTGTNYHSIFDWYCKWHSKTYSTKTPSLQHIQLFCIRHVLYNYLSIQHPLLGFPFNLHSFLNFSHKIYI